MGIGRPGIARTGVDRLESRSMPSVGMHDKHKVAVYEAKAQHVCSTRWSCRQ